MIKKTEKNHCGSHRGLRRFIALLAAAAAVFAALFASAVPTAAGKAEFEYKLKLTNGSGEAVTNPRLMKAGDVLNVEIELERTDTKAVSYKTYGVEFRLMGRGLKYNGDGATFHDGIEVRELVYTLSKSVGFAYYDMDRNGVRVNNPMLAAKWSYTIEDPSSVNITVPVALLYNVEDSEVYEVTGKARLFLDPNGGQLEGNDISGEYESGTKVVLPKITNGGYRFVGWSDGEKVYPGGSEYTVSGVVTLTALWEGIVRTRQIIFSLDGGEFTEIDPSGMYADGETVIMPEAKKKGKVLEGWKDNELNIIRKPGSEYTVDNSKVFIAVWKDEEPEPGPGPGPGPEPPGPDERTWFRFPDGSPDWGHIALTGILGILLGCGFFFIIILWKRRWVLYSLKNGDIALSVKEKESDFTVKVILINKDKDTDREEEIVLDTSRPVEKGHRLRFIVGSYDVADVEKGRYKGRLEIACASPKTKKCRIKVLDREIRERKNR